MTLLFALAVEHLHAFHFDFEEQFNGGLDFRLGRVLLTKAAIAKIEESYK